MVIHPHGYILTYKFVECVERSEAHHRSRNIYSLIEAPRISTNSTLGHLKCKNFHLRKNYMSSKEHRINNVSEAINWSKTVLGAFLGTDSNNSHYQQPPVHVWYRGHNRDDYELIPNVFREAAKNNGKTYEEGGMLRHLMNRLPQYLDNCPTTFDCLSLSRHYELPCRLLDWTENVLIALWFAVEESDKSCINTQCEECKKQNKERNAKIFALNARELSKHTDFKLFQRKELAVNSPNTFNVILRSELALTSYLDDLLRKHSVRSAALNLGFSNDFWESLINLISHVGKNDIEAIESINKIDDSFVSFGEIPKEFLRIDSFKNIYDEFNNKMPNWLIDDPNYKDIKTAQFARLWLYNFLFSLRKPVAVFPERRNIRITAQSGMFVLSGGDYIPKKCIREFSDTCRNPKPIDLEAWAKDENVIKTAIIPNECKNNIQKELAMIGFHGANLFPDLDKQATYLKEYWYVDL